MVLDPVETNQKDVLTVSLGSVRLLRENGLVSWTYSARRCLADFYSASTIINAGCGNTPLVNLTRYLKDPAAAKTVGISATKPVKELLGVFVPANGSPSIFMSPTGVLLPLVASHTASPTNLSPLNMSVESLLSFYGMFSRDRVGRYIETLRSFDAIGHHANTLGSSIFRESVRACMDAPLPWARHRGDLLLGVLFKDTLDKAVAATIEQACAGIYSPEYVSFGAVHGGHGIAVILWGGFATKKVIGYIPTEKFSEFVLMGSPLLSGKELEEYIRVPTTKASRTHLSR